MKTYSAIILDNENENVELLKLYLNKYFKEITTIYTVNNNDDALEVYLDRKPELLFLDIELDNNKTSFSFLEHIDKKLSQVIFISAYDSYALKALNINVTGYILKPIEITTLVSVTKKAISNLNYELIPKTVYPEIIAINSINKIEIVNTNELIYLEADGKYTILHSVKDKSFTGSSNIGVFEELLNPKLFFRIHHKYIVNLSKVLQIDKTGGNYCELINSISLPIAKRRQDTLSKFLKIK